MSRRAGISFLALAFVMSLMVSVSAFADSQARVVRLSDVQGDVQIDRATGQGYEKAFLNIPITQDTRLKTASDGRAEVEFEDGTVIHLTPGSAIEFTSLSLRDSGARVSSVDVQKGEAYFNFAGKKDDEFTVSFLHQKATLTQSAHFRVNLNNDAKASLAVFKGEVVVDGPQGQIEVGKKQTAEFTLADNEQAALVKNIDADPFDGWDKQQGEYHDRYSNSKSYAGGPSYGASDLSYYGNYMNVPGYGMMWQPYFTGIGWDPFMDGAWMWYPGFGYTWVSAYPWGWLPYHYGGWAFVPGFGWLWSPGSSFVVFNPVVPVIRPPAHFVPPRPPVVAASHSTVVVGRGFTPSSSLVPRATVVVRGTSAGLGVPRGISNLGRINQEVARTGAVAVPSTTRVTTGSGGGMHGGGMSSGRSSGSQMSGSRMSSGGHTSSGGMSSGGGHTSASHSGSHH